MNLRQQTTPVEDAEKTTGKTAWYLPIETPTEAQILSLSLPVPSPLALFDPTAAERILARAVALQEVHGQMLTCEQVEAIAAEIGIKPEFVQLAIEQESTGVAVQPLLTVVPPRITNLARLRIVSTLIACTVVATTYGVVASTTGEVARLQEIIAITLFPLMLSFSLGVLGRSRRSGSLSGLAIALTAIAMCFILNFVQGKPSSSAADTLYAISLMISISTSFGLIGAQGGGQFPGVWRRGDARRSKWCPPESPLDAQSPFDPGVVLPATWVCLVVRRGKK